VAAPVNNFSKQRKQSGKQNLLRMDRSLDSYSRTDHRRRVGGLRCLISLIADRD
jgi:hypothetical protein